MIEKLRAWNMTYIVSILLFIKILFFGISFSDCLGALVLLSVIQLERLMDYLYPKRVDVFKELSLIQSKLTELESKSEDYGRDLTALKLQSVRGK